MSVELTISVTKGAALVTGGVTVMATALIMTAVDKIGQGANAIYQKSQQVKQKAEEAWSIISDYGNYVLGEDMQFISLLVSTYYIQRLGDQTVIQQNTTFNIQNEDGTYPSVMSETPGVLEYSEDRGIQGSVIWIYIKNMTAGEWKDDLNNPPFKEGGSVNLNYIDEDPNYQYTYRWSIDLPIKEEYWGPNLEKNIRELTTKIITWNKISGERLRMMKKAAFFSIGGMGLYTFFRAFHCRGMPWSWPRRLEDLGGGGEEEEDEREKELVIRVGEPTSEQMDIDEYYVGEIRDQVTIIAENKPITCENKPESSSESESSTYYSCQSEIPCWSISYRPDPPSYTYLPDPPMCSTYRPDPPSYQQSESAESECIPPSYQQSDSAESECISDCYNKFKPRDLECYEKCEKRRKLMESLGYKGVLSCTNQFDAYRHCEKFKEEMESEGCFGVVKCNKSS